MEIYRKDIALNFIVLLSENELIRSFVFHHEFFGALLSKILDNAFSLIKRMHCIMVHFFEPVPVNVLYCPKPPRLERSPWPRPNCLRYLQLQSFALKNS